MPSELSSLYKNRPVVLWVEDPLTRTWLHHLWQDADIGLLVAGGNDAVFAAVRDARAEGHVNVFGFRDRDFIPSNQARWGDPAKGLAEHQRTSQTVNPSLLNLHAALRARAGL